MLHRCVYYKVPRDRLTQACAAVRAVQRSWMTREPGLQAQLLLREDDASSEGPATLMEVWLWPGADGVPSGGPPPWAALEAELAHTLGDALIGRRHVEAFGAAPG